MNQEPIEPVIIPDSPEFLTPKREARSNSTGKDITRSSPSPLASNEKPLPHYLRASAGSCHDYCKYGRKHAFEDKARRPNFRRSSGDNEISEKVRNQVEVSPRGGRKKKPVQKLKPTSQHETELSGQSNVVKNNGLSAAKDIQVCEYGSEGFLSSSQNSISSTDRRYSDKAEGLSEEHVESIGPSVVEKSVITNELIVSTREDVLLEEYMSNVMPSSGWGTAANEAGGLYGKLHEAVSPLQGGIVGFAASTLSNQEEISGNQAVKPSGEPLKASPSSSQSTKARSSKTSDSNKREAPKPRSVPKPKNEMPVKAKAIAQKETDVPGKSSIIKQKAPSAIKKTMTSDQQKTIKQKRPNTGSSGTAEVLKLKASSPLKKTDISARASTSLKPKASATKSLSLFTTAGGPDSSRSKPSQIPRTQDLPKSVEKKVLKLPRASLSPKIGDKKVLKTPRASLSPKIGQKMKTPRASLSPKIGEKKVLKKPRASLSLNIGDKKVLKAPRVFLSPRPALTRISSMKLRKFGNKKLGSPVKNAKKVSAQDDNDQVKEKTIYAIDPEPEIKSEGDVPQKSTDYKSSTSSQSLSVTSSQSTASDISHENEENEENEDTESTYTEVSVVSEDEDTESDNELEPQEVEERRMSRKKSVAHPDDEAQPPHKLKFRRGKVLDPQSQNNGPRRLRFRKPRVVTENENGRGELGRRSFRKRSNISGVDTNEVTEAPNVVLRHQDQQGKKDSQGLFNHVIEETASKLVESRKSKVKALVGAFETVISLQDTKAAPTV
ncbi:Calmodulin-binding domain plant domain-containing protein [Dioscorea alata]|uniref:Calmodulin-binding domain plant domain-containing protein n=2 Tax=Dioscorea alata TaxID=55571 RepID=A0ACB7UJQ8_DIOAL|nr:Calmodulin-binding domain plant domain-containing protein [Dioscorea alata]KAH7660714.1 Calmodulin-binding domain plant domain-containing protein [Dioscorea alata]